ncbi:MAG TPA: hypothetical protein VGI39_41940 [Polyangiaceae bacterium]
MTSGEAGDAGGIGTPVQGPDATPSGGNDADNVPPSSGGDDASTSVPDAADPGNPDSGGAGSTDSGGTTPPVDAGAPKDAGSNDTGTGVVDSAPPPGFCAALGSAALFCDDFDESTALAAPWDQLTGTGGSEAASSASSVSSPHSMLVTVNSNQPDNAIDLAGYKSFPSKQGVAGIATLTFEIEINAADKSSNSDAILGAIQLWNGSAYFDVELEAFYQSGTNDFKVSMSEYGSTNAYVQHFVSQHIALGVWTKVALGITLPAAGNGSAPATLAINGVNAASVTVNVTTNNPIPEILVGTTFATPTSGGWAIGYDNVTFEEP